MVNSAKEIENISDNNWELKAFINEAIILSYASLEAALNEIIHLRALQTDSPLDEKEREVFLTIGTEGLQPQRESNTLQKFNLLLRSMRKPELNPGEITYQAANYVRVLRNMLVHPTPGRVVTFTDNEEFDYSSQQDIVKKLRSYLKLGKDATFPVDILTTTCASWAVDSCEEFLHKFVRTPGINPGFTTST